VFALGALLFLFVTLGIGVLISTVSQNQGQAIQLAVMTMLPQVLLSGLIFPLSAIVVGVRWIAYLLPLTYFNEIARGVMLRAEPIGPLWAPLTILALLGVGVGTLAILRFRGYLAPTGGGHGGARRPWSRPHAAAGQPAVRTGPAGSPRAVASGGTE
ncbi:MAG TPA: ABC transporter permease, partial [Streptosporangiaceae bacterium]|nr:ABC transporter permease [Streptosporangiaceae bacterium]